MSTSTQALFQPLEIGDITMQDRITMSALTRNRAENTYPTELMEEYYVQRVHGGAGLIVTEGILITRQGYLVSSVYLKVGSHYFRRTEWPHAIGIWDDKHVEGWKNITDAVHEAGGKIYAQLWHGKIRHSRLFETMLTSIFTSRSRCSS